MNVLADTMRTNGTAGAALGVVIDGEPAFSGALGVRARGEPAPVTTRTLFRVESMTKTFSAMAVLSLVEQRRLALDEPIRSYVPSFSVAQGADTSAVTLRRLLTHTAGLARNTTFRLRTDRPGHEWEDLFTQNASKLTLGPIGQYVYSNIGYLLVGAAIEHAAGAPYATALRERVLRPLGMTSATADGDEADRGEFASGHVVDERSQNRIVRPPWLDPYVQRAVGGLHLGIDELVSFAARFLARAPEVLTPESFDAMTTPYVATDDPPLEYGYGIYLNTKGERMWITTGAGMGTRSWLFMVPRRRYAFALLVNDPGFNGWRALRQISDQRLLGW